jgi:hypothetical protein
MCTGTRARAHTHTRVRAHTPFKFITTCESVTLRGRRGNSSSTQGTRILMPFDVILMCRAKADTRNSLNFKTEEITFKSRLRIFVSQFNLKIVILTCVFNLWNVLLHISVKTAVNNITSVPLIRIGTNHGYVSAKHVIYQAHLLQLMCVYVQVRWTY